jgi:ABC-type nitrate/sulfonate/bicarbonate transport system permease component
MLFAAEMVGSRSGLGWLIKQSEQGLRFDLMYVSILTIAILGWAGDTLLRAARGRLVAWADQR